MAAQQTSQDKIPAARLLYSRMDAAALLSLSARKLDELIKRGEIRIRRVGGKVMIHREELARFARTGQTTWARPTRGRGIRPVQAADAAQ